LAKGEFAQGHHAGYNLDKTRLDFANRGKTVAIIDLKERKLIKTVESGYGAGHANASPDGKLLKINVESLTFSKEIKVGDWPSIMVQLD